MSTNQQNQSESVPAAPKARYIMIGGFLGAGKTTAVGKLATHLADQRLRVGLITNDQGRNLVDTTMLRSQGFATEEIPGGCFCCRFNSLVAAAQRLTETTRPDVFVAEPVKSGQLIINLRAEAAPDVLGTAVREGLAATAKRFPGLEATLDHLEHFRPGKPTPTHRLEGLPA